MQDKVTVIIPTLNEEKYISRCLDSVISQTYPFDKLEVLVVDGGSIDMTCQIVQAYIIKYSNISLISNPERIQSVAFNIGVANSKAPYIIRLDAHAEYDTRYIELCVFHLSRSKEIGDVGGIWDIRSRGNGLIQEANAILNKSKFGIGGAAFRIGASAGFVDTVPFGAFRRDVVEEIGGMREDMPRAEDNEYVSRLHKAGYKIYLDPQIISIYYSRDTYNGALKQMYANGKSIAHLSYIDKSAIGIRHLIPFAFVMSIIICGVLSLFLSHFIYLLLMILSTYFVCAILATVKECRKYGIKYFMILPHMFFLVHVSYGIGTLLGYFKYFGSASNYAPRYYLTSNK